MKLPPLIYVVDNDPAARAALCEIVAAQGGETCVCSDSAELLNSCEDTRPGCIVYEHQLPGADSVSLLAVLRRLGVQLPTIVTTADGNLRMAVRAMQAGAVTVLQKPWDESEFTASLATALRLDQTRRDESERRAAIRRRFDSLTAPEREVLQEVLAGSLNKHIANRLDVSMRTIEARRHAIFKKAGVKSVADLVRLAIEAGLDANGHSCPRP